MNSGNTPAGSAGIGHRLALGASRLRNRLRQWTHPGRKIFIIGPHRCATTTLHQFFASQGLVSFHWRKGQTYLAKEINDRLADDGALRRFLMKWTVYSDFVYLADGVHIENHTQYRKFQQLFPEAYFIFNDRDVDRWVNSRLLHRDGQWVDRYLQVRGGTRAEAIETWKRDFLENRAATLAHFEGNPRFFHYRIDDPAAEAAAGRPRIDELIEFLSPDYALSNTLWQSFNTKRAGMKAKETAAG